MSFSGWKINARDKTKKAKPDFRQKGVDMKIGLDMAWMTGRNTINKIVLVASDSDFVSPMKLVRRVRNTGLCIPNGKQHETTIY